MPKPELAQWDLGGTPTDYPELPDSAQEEREYDVWIASQAQPIN